MPPKPDEELLLELDMSPEEELLESASPDEELLDEELLDEELLDEELLDELEDEPCPDEDPLEEEEELELEELLDAPSPPQAARNVEIKTTPNPRVLALQARLSPMTYS